MMKGGFDDESMINKETSESKETSHSVKNGSTIFKQAFVVNKNPFPWGKAFIAGLQQPYLFLLGCYLGHLEYGLLSGIGAFTYLYVFDIPYVQRAKKIFWAMLGISFSVFLGTLLAPYPIAVAIAMGLIGATRHFYFWCFKNNGTVCNIFRFEFCFSNRYASGPIACPLSWWIGSSRWRYCRGF